jgi:hypothetical protein
MTYTDLFSNQLPIYVSEKTGLKFYCRPNTSDLKTVKEVVDGGAYQKRYFQIESANIGWTLDRDWETYIGS